MLAMRSFATRRMWLKRARNTFIALRILAYPLYPLLWVYWYFRWIYQVWMTDYEDSNGDAKFASVFTLAVILLVTIGCISKWHYSRLATPEQIMAARKADSCFDDTILRRAAKLDRALTYGDVSMTMDDCEDYWKKERAKKSQADALQRQLGQPKM